MQIRFRSSKLQKTCSDERLLVKAYGASCGRKVARRLTVLRAAQSLADVPKLPPDRCHPLKGGREGQFAVDVEQPHQLIFRPDHDPVPETNDGGVDLTQVTEIEIIEIEDYH